MYYLSLISPPSPICHHHHCPSPPLPSSSSSFPKMVLLSDIFSRPV